MRWGEQRMFHELTEAELPSALQSTQGKQAFFFYTPLCGTCKLAQKMCTVAMEALPGTTVYACNVSRFPNQVQAWKIESVPCLVIAKGSDVLHKVYAFESVDKVYHLLKACQTL
jgi:hypothetical protein